MSKVQQLETTLRAMTDNELKLLKDIMDTIDGRPDRREFALQWTGRMSDLPEALKAID